MRTRWCLPVLMQGRFCCVHVHRSQTRGSQCGSQDLIEDSGRCGRTTGMYFGAGQWIDCVTFKDMSSQTISARRPRQTLNFSRGSTHSPQRTTGHAAQCSPGELAPSPRPECSAFCRRAPTCGRCCAPHRRRTPRQLPPSPQWPRPPSSTPARARRVRCSPPCRARAG